MSQSQLLPQTIYGYVGSQIRPTRFVYQKYLSK